MKKIFAVIAALSIVMATTGCSQQKTIEGKTYQTYGFATKDQKANPGIEYEVCVGNVIWSIILCETIVAPIYFIGFDLFQPVSTKITNDSERGVIR